MKVTVLLFGPTAAAAGARQVIVEIGDGNGIADLRLAILQQHARLADSLSSGRLAVNSEFVPESTFLNPGDEVALIGMVSGG